MMKSKKAAVVWGEILGILTMLLLLAVIAWIMYDQVSPAASSPLKSCSGGVWSVNPCNTAVSQENIIIKPTEIDNVMKFCCMPISGREKNFNTFYEDELTINTGSSGSGSTSSTGSNNAPIQFVLNGKNIETATSTQYTKGMQLQGLILSENNQSFQVVQNLKEELGKDYIGRCRTTVYPAKIDPTTNILHINTVANTANVLVFEQEICEQSITIPSSKLALLDDPEYADPGFYKWDFKYWKKGNTGDQWDGSETTFIDIRENIAAPKAGTQKFVTYTQRISRNNIATCYLFVGVVNEELDNHLPEKSSFFFDGSNENIISLPRTIVLNPKDYGVVFEFSEKGVIDGIFEKSYTFEECNKVVVFNLTYYEENYQSCTNLNCNIYNRKSCLFVDPRNPDNTCTSEVQNCYWDYVLVGGACLNCDADIKSCSDYDRQTCASNQCFDGVNMKERCFVNGNKDCATCALGLESDPCVDYDKKSICEADPCNYKGLMNETCKWESNTCVTA